MHLMTLNDCVGRNKSTAAWCSMDNWQPLTNNKIVSGELSDMSGIIQVGLLKLVNDSVSTEVYIQDIQYKEQHI